MNTCLAALNFLLHLLPRKNIEHPEASGVQGITI